MKHINNNNKYIYCIIRNKYVKFTYEEYIRQNTILYFLKKKISICNISVEKKIIINRITKRIDILIYKYYKPYIIIECKSFNNKINKKNIIQLNNYLLFVPTVKILILTNGINRYIFTKKNNI